MDKEEILRRSRKENDISDERAKYIDLKSAKFSISVLVILWIVLLRSLKLDDTVQYAMGLLVTATCFCNFAYQFSQNRTKTVIFFTVMFFAATTFYLVLILKFVLGIF